jgi:hypothetical protein
MFLRVFVRDKLYFPPSPANVDDLWVENTGEFAEVTPDIFRHTWEEINCRWQICRARA